MVKLGKILCCTLLTLLFSGCATTDYTTHYAIFEAENSAGEERLFRVYWQTVRYEGWLGNKYRALPLVLESQCSARTLRFYDASFGVGRRCVDDGSNADRGGDGIAYCGSSSEDENRRGRPIRDKSLCGAVTDREGSKSILALDGELLITLGCRPKSTERRVGFKKQNIDYLMGSAIPYIVSTKVVKGKDIEKILPEVSQHSSICDPS